MDGSTQLDIIIVNYNSTDYLLRCLESVYRGLGGRTAGIHIADNGSTDNVERLLDRFPEIDLHINACNLGFARAVNQCIEKSGSPYLLILNPDTIIRGDFFDSVLAFMDTHQQVGVLGPKIYDHDLKVQGSARSFPTPVTALFGRNTMLTRCFPNNRISRKNILNTFSDGHTPMSVDWLSGACMFVRRQAVDAVGGLDNQFFMYWEDADWCIRLKKAGWDIIYYPAASVVHFVGGSSERNLLKAVLEFHKSAYYFFNKYYQSPFGVLKPLVIMGLSIRVCFVLAVHGIRRWVTKNKDCSDTRSAEQVVKEA
ncbi:MAG: glycosyltransferase family 2 protein [Desulfosalsimonadaceae bacterium]